MPWRVWLAEELRRFCMTSSSMDWPLPVFEKTVNIITILRKTLRSRPVCAQRIRLVTGNTLLLQTNSLPINSNMVCIKLVVCSSELPYSNHSDRWPSTAVLRIPHYEHVIFGPCLRRDWLPLSEPGGDTGPSPTPHSPTSQLIKTSSSLIKKEESLGDPPELY